MAVEKVQDQDQVWDFYRYIDPEDNDLYPEFWGGENHRWWVADSRAFHTEKFMAIYHVPDEDAARLDVTAGHYVFTAEYAEDGAIEPFSIELVRADSEEEATAVYEGSLIP